MTYSLTTPVRGPADCTVAQIVGAVLAAPQQDGWPVRTRYTDAELVEWAERGIHWTGAFGFGTAGLVGQSLHETNHLRYTGDVPFGTHNFAGIGATGAVPGERFDSIDAGWLAFCCHMALYVYGEPSQWPEHLRGYASKAVRLTSVRWAHENLRRPDGSLLRFFAAVTVWGDFLNGRWAHTQALPVGTLANRYAERSTDKANLVLAQPRGEFPPMTAPKIALSAGHHNTSGGNALEIEQVGPLTKAIAVACRAAGFDVRVITPDEGLGHFPGTLSQAAAKVVEWARAGWVADIFLEVHTEGAGRTVRGAFAIYPDWGDDVDTDVRDRLGPDLVRRLTQATGLPKRGNGLMSEKNTYVGSQGHRLGVFGATEPVKATTTRLIVEFGSHDNPDDLAIFNRPTFNGDAATAVTKAFAAFTGWSGAVRPDPTPQKPPRPAWVTDDSARYFPETGQWMQWAFKGKYEELGERALMIYGYPLSAEIEEDGRTVQYLERAVFEWHPDNPEPYRVLLRRLGAEAFERRAA
jgi:hypothetical protein